MKTIKEHIAKGQFARFYLLYGSEEYLKNLYADKLMKAMVVEGDTMNLAVYEGNRLSLTDVIAIANTLPFFAARRVLIIKNSGLFKGSSEDMNAFETLPDTTVVLFVEKEVDKRSRLFSIVRDGGYVSEMNGLTENDLRLFVASGFKRRGLLISNNCIEYFLERIGTDMVRITNEIEKLSAYCAQKQEVQPRDIREVTTATAEGHIFSMIDAVAAGDEKRAVALYGELLTAQEKPLRILYLLTKNYYQLSLVLKMSARGIAAGDIATKLSMKPFVVNKFLRNNRNTSLSQVMEAISYGNDMEYRIKSGDMEEHVAVEMYLLHLCQQKKQKILAKSDFI